MSINLIEQNVRNDMVDYVTPQPKRLSNTSSLTSKSWISTKSYASDRTTPASIISVGGTKSTADSEESTPRSSDLDSNSEDTDVISNTINDYLQNSDSCDAN